MCQSIGQVAICSMKHNNLQHIVGELMTCVEEAKQYEKEILQKYIAKCEVFYGCCIIIIYITASGVLLGPIFLETPFPFEVEYPFSINYTLIYVIMYFHQFIAILQCTAHVCLSGFGALLLWFLAVRFECLAVDFQKCSDVNMMTDCIKKQLRLRRYAENISNCFRFIIAYAIIVSTVSIIICGLLLTTNLVPPVVKLQFILVSGTVLIEVYMYAWPAEYVMDTSINVSRCVYNLLWYDHTLALQKYLLNVLAFQKPVTISVTLLLPELSLRYFCAYLTNAFSIFTTVRAVVVED
ncbi:PREDICTED: odorant receptor 24a-like [Eufriesea mexicana]|uniref:odorant receptor 24a-like n=1 Tax=Eufriesea mexicana TaxID=516756 RepID=UPI00083C277A|nr:PREDICTED: odorant receptor 24a-like [Eufriesea mexicana]